MIEIQQLKNQPAPKTLERAKLLWNHPEGPGYHRIGLSCGPGYALAVPGQFVTLHLPGNQTPLLRRPFSIHRLVKENRRVIGLEILFKVVGGFTEKLSQTPPGAAVDLLGPIGRGFTVSKQVQHPVLVGGGIGVAPLVFLADTLAESGIDPQSAAVFIGGRSANDILCEDIFRAHGFPVTLTTDDGSRGEKHPITAPLARRLDKNPPDILYACGPMPMLRTVADMSRNKNIRCELSIETVMACGLGACLGCAVNRDEQSGTYQHVCVDGPVFDASATRF